MVLLSPAVASANIIPGSETMVLRQAEAREANAGTLDGHGRLHSSARRRDEAAGLAAGNVSMTGVCLVAAPAERCCDQQKVET